MHFKSWLLGHFKVLWNQVGYFFTIFCVLHRTGTQGTSMMCVAAGGWGEDD